MLILRLLLCGIFMRNSLVVARGLFYSILELQQSNEFQRWMGNVNNASGYQLHHQNQYPVNQTNLCKKLFKHQQSLCLNYFNLIPTAFYGISRGLQECQRQFIDHHWNCSGHNVALRNLRQNNNKKKKTKKNKIVQKTYLDRMMDKGLRESGYVLAIISAGVTYEVTKACSKGWFLYFCSCDRTAFDVSKILELDRKLRGDARVFQWSGCNDHVYFGTSFARKFLDGQHKRKMKRRPKLGWVSLHNSRVGRTIVINNMQIKCVCHGTSGACDTKICYRAMPSLSQMAEVLKKQFNSALQIQLKNSELYPTQGGKRVKSNALVYVRKRRGNYCNHNPRIGVFGTHGRACNMTKIIPGQQGNHCQVLCCGRGYTERTYIKYEQCRCKFMWCCEVVCDKCQRYVTETKCN